jgi:opacity protein-like surface antigen
VIRASGGIYYANSGNAAVPPTAGFGNTPSFVSPDRVTPLYYLDSGTFPQTFARPPVLDPTFLNGQSILYVPRTGTRLPQTINWTFGIQREIAPNTTVEASYIGSRSTHLGFSANYNYMPLSGLQYGSLLLQPITSPAAVAAGFTPPYPSFVNQRGANTVYQSLRPYPQYTGVTTGGGVFFGGNFGVGVADPVGQSKYNSLQVKVTKRLSGGLTLFGFVTWSKGFTMVTDQYPGARMWQLDGALTLGPGLLPGVRAERDETWVDPIIGLRARHVLNDRWRLEGYADIGGFGVASNFTWQVYGGVGADITDRVTARLGYRHLAVDYEKDGFLWDVSLSGPILGVTVRL